MWDTLFIKSYVHIANPRAQNLRHGSVMKTSFEPVFKNGFRQFCGYRYFCYEILFHVVSYVSIFVVSLKSKSTKC